MKKLLAVALLAGSSAFAQNNFSFGISIGGPPPPPPVYGYYQQPRSPGYGYVWVPGYYSVNQNNYRWQNGYYTRPPHPRAKWVKPKYKKNRYYPGYWR